MFRATRLSPLAMSSHSAAETRRLFIVELEGEDVRSVIRRTVVVLVALTMTVTAAACTKKNQTAEPAASASGGGGTVKVAFVPKLQGIPYFEAMNAGGKEAASKLSGVEWLYQGPTSADAAAQSDIVNSYIQQKVERAVHRSQRSRLDGAADQAGHRRRNQGRHL